MIGMMLGIAVMVMAGCAQDNPIAPSGFSKKGSAIQAQSLGAPGSEQVASGQVTIAKGMFYHQEPLVISGENGQAVFQAVHLGHWDIYVELFNAQGILIYAGAAEAVVKPKKTTEVMVTVTDDLGSVTPQPTLPGQGNPPENNTSTLIVKVDIPVPPIPEGLILWNKLGSVEEVTHSVVGPNLTFSLNATDGIVFEPVKYDNGFRSESRWRGVEVPPTILNPVRGCYEMWFKSQVTRPVAYLYGRLQWLDQSSLGTGGLMQLVWDDGTPYGGPNNSIDVCVGTLNMSIGTFTAEIGRLYHIAMVWDVNGIGGSSDTVRIYIDGILHASTTQSYNPIPGNGVGNIGRIQNTTPGWGDCFGKLTFDNLKIWNYPKTDFSDRFTE